MVFLKLVSALLLMAACVIIHAAGLTALVRRVRAQVGRRHRLLSHPMWLLVRVAAFTIVLHLLQIVAWGVYYTWNAAMPDLDTAFYFSAVTYTTTGYGDLVLPPKWRVAGGVEALTGILMCGLSAGMYFAVFSRLFGLTRSAAPAEEPPHEQG
jgi:hypothetical protein